MVLAPNGRWGAPRMLYIAYFNQHGLKMLRADNKADASRRFMRNAGGAAPAWMQRIPVTLASLAYDLGRLGWQGDAAAFNAEAERYRAATR